MNPEQRNNINRIKNLIIGFAIGDALGDPFEFKDPHKDEIHKRYYSNSEFNFTDDTKLEKNTTYLFLNNEWIEYYRGIYTYSNNNIS